MKILITADVHIKNYTKYNKTENFRLNQFIKLAELINDTCIKKDCQHIIIAGDLLDEYKPEPIVYQTLYRFLEIITRNAKVYLIHGNHDCSKGSYSDGNTYYPILNKKNLNVDFIHDDYRNIDGKVFYFRGWEPSMRGFPEANVIITHAYISGASLPNGLKVKDGDGLTCDLFDYCFVGDIHKHQSFKVGSGEVVIPGTPIQNSYSDDPETGFILFDTDGSWERISTKENPDFLKFQYEDSKKVKECLKESKKLAKDGKTVEQVMLEEFNIVCKERPTKDITKTFDIKSIDSVNLNEILDELIKDFPYRDDLLKCFGKNKKALESFINQELKVALYHIKITNFKSIEDYELNFTELGKLTLITGSNGVGKTTLLEAIMWAFTGNSASDIDDVVQSGKKYCEVDLTVNYGGSVIRINRSRGSKFEFHVYHDGTEITESGKAELQKKLEQILPVINKLHLLYFNQSRDGLLSELNDASRVSLISELSGQSVVAELSEDVEELLEAVKEDSKQTENNFNLVESKLNGLKGVYQEVENPSPKVEIVNSQLSKLLEDREQKIQEIRKIAKTITEELEEDDKANADRIQAANTKIAEIELKNKELTQKKQYQDKIINKKLQWNCPTCNTLITAKDFTQEDRDNAVKEAEGLTAEIQRCLEVIAKLKALRDQVAQTQVKKKIELKDRIAEATKELAEEVEQSKQAEASLRETLSSLMVEMGVFKKSQEIKTSIKDLQAKHAVLKEATEEAKAKYSAFKKINSDVFGMDGLLSAAVLERLAKVINTDENVRITTTRVLKNGKVKPDLSMAMKDINGHYQPYNRTSGGEKLLLDFYLLKAVINMVGGIGFWIGDESFKYASPDTAEKMFEMLLQSNIQNAFVVYHGEIPSSVKESDDLTYLNVSKKAGYSLYEKI